MVWGTRWGSPPKPLRAVPGRWAGAQEAGVRPGAPRVVRLWGPLPSYPLLWGPKLSAPLLLVQRICFFLSLPRDAGLRGTLRPPALAEPQGRAGSGLWPWPGASRNQPRAQGSAGFSAVFPALPVPAAARAGAGLLHSGKATADPRPCPGPDVPSFALTCGLGRLSGTGSRGCWQEASAPRGAEGVTAAVSLTP